MYKTDVEISTSVFLFGMNKFLRFSQLAILLFLNDT